jgi:RNA polymerase sigma-70 factor (ECF subfamily)
MAATTTAPQDQILAAAVGGDEQAFRLLVEPHRTELHAHCYRMLGSLHDAEDALQDALLRAWRGLHGVRSRDALRAWLYRIATNSCFDVAKRRPSRTMPADHGPASSVDDDPTAPLGETAWLEPYPDGVLGIEDGRSAPAARYEQREAVELAFVAALQHLPAKPRAALILREVLGYSAQEVADTLDTSVAAVNSALQRARKTLDERLPASTQQATVRRLGDQRRRTLVADFVEAWVRADVDRLATLLADDATFCMPPGEAWWSGRESVLGFVTRVKVKCPESRWVPVSANGQVAFGCYLGDPMTGSFVPATITTLDLDGDRVRDITSFVLPDLFPAFGLPPAAPT